MNFDLEAGAQETGDMLQGAFNWASGAAMSLGRGLGNLASNPTTNNMLAGFAAIGAAALASKILPNTSLSLGGFGTTGGVILAGLAAATVVFGFKDRPEMGAEVAATQPDAAPDAAANQPLGGYVYNDAGSATDSAAADNQEQTVATPPSPTTYSM